MWNKWLTQIQDLSYKRLGIALCISALLHFFLVDSFYKLLPDSKPELHTIEARLQMPKLATKPVATLPAQAPPKPEKPVKARPVKALKPVEPESIKPEASKPVENAVPTEPQPAPSEPLATDGKSVDIGDPIPTPTEEQKQAEEEPLAINENAYQYVETTFNVSTKIGGSPEGKATMIYHLLDGEHYQINSVAKAGGLAALVLSDLLQSSEGMLTKSGLQPNKYTYNYGNKASKSRLAKFNWQEKIVEMQTAAGTQREQLLEDTQDLLSFMYQFMYVPPLHKMHIHIVNGKSLHTYHYSFEGENSILLPMGELNTIHIQHSNNENEEKIELWLAVDYQYLPVKILKIDKNGKVYEFTATRINTTRP